MATTTTRNAGEAICEAWRRGTDRRDADLLANLYASDCEHVIINRNSPPSRPTVLKGREAEVLAWVAQGKTNREIGMILGASARTVQKHLEHVFQKIGVETRTAAILRAWQAGRYALLAPR